MRAFQQLLATALFMVAVLLPTAAFAGEVKLGKAPLATDGSGNITAAGRKAAINELASEPGEEIWHVHVWAKIDKGGPGPLYVEFFGKLPDGKRYVALRHAKDDYKGEKYVSMAIDLEGNSGFNKGRTYAVEVSQQGKKGNIKLASTTLKIVYTEAEPAKDEGGDDEGDDEEDGGDDAAQDELDTLASAGDPEVGDGPPPVAPPGKKKGCSVDPGAYGFPAVLVLFALGAGVTRRGRSRTRA